MIVFIEIGQPGAAINKIEKELRSGNPDYLVLKHKNENLEILFAAEYLKKHYDISKIIDWYCGEAQDTYRRLIQNFAGLEYNPIDLVILGKETGDIWSKLDLVEIVGFSAIAIEEKCYHLDSYLYTKMLEELDMMSQRNCSEKEVEKFVSIKQIPIAQMENRVAMGLRAESFYDEEYTWGMLFGKNQSVDLQSELKKMHSRTVTKLWNQMDDVKKEVYVKLEGIIKDYGKDMKYGPGFISYFLNQLVCYLEKVCNTIHGHAKSMKEKDIDYRTEIKEAYENAQGASKYFGNRDEYLEDYIDIMENYRVHKCKMEQAVVAEEILKDLMQYCKKKADELQAALEQLHSVVEQNITFDSLTEEITVPDLEENLWDTLINMIESGKSFESADIYPFLDPHQETVAAVILEQENGNNCYLDGTTLSVVNKEQWNPVFTGFTPEFEALMKEKGQLISGVKERIYQYIQSGIITYKESDYYQLNMMQELPEMELETMNFIEVMQKYQELEVWEKSETSILRQEEIQVSGGLQGLAEYVWANQAIQNQLEAELKKREALKDKKEKMLQML